MAGEIEESSLHNISKQIGKKFSLEDLLPPKQQIPSTTEGNKSNILILQMRLTISLPKTTYNKSSLENKVSHQVVLLYFFYLSDHPLLFIPTIENLLQVPIAIPRHPILQFKLSQEVHFKVVLILFPHS